MDAHFVVSLQIHHLRCTCAQNMLASGQKWQEGIDVALSVGDFTSNLDHARTAAAGPRGPQMARRVEEYLSDIDLMGRAAGLI